MAAEISDCAFDRITAWVWAKRVMTFWLVLWVVTCIPVSEGKVTCNEYGKCFPAPQQLNLTQAIREGHKKHACVIVTSAMKCLNEARKDCDDVRYQNLPDFIVQELENKRNNVTVYAATYCGEISATPTPSPTPTSPSSSSSIQQGQQAGSNGGDVPGVRTTVTVGWTLLLIVFLSEQ